MSSYRNVWDGNLFKLFKKKSTTQKKNEENEKYEKSLIFKQTNTILQISFIQWLNPQNLHSMDTFSNCCF